jgi:hypothetical protein
MCFLWGTSGIVIYYLDEIRSFKGLSEHFGFPIVNFNSTHLSCGFEAAVRWDSLSWDSVTLDWSRSKIRRHSCIAVPITNFTRNMCKIRPAGSTAPQLEVSAVRTAETNVFVYGNYYHIRGIFSGRLMYYDTPYNNISSSKTQNCGVAARGYF